MKGKATKYGCKKGSRGDFVPFRLPLAGSRGGAPLWGLGQRPNCFSGAQFQRSRQQRRRQRSVPASNFALPQERPPSCSFHLAAPHAPRQQMCPPPRPPPHAGIPRWGPIAAPNGRDRPSRAARKSSRTRRPAAFICLIHFAQCFSFGSMSAKYARTCSGCHASFDMCGTRNASSSSTELYANFPSV